jgi:hypothetical protein
VSGRLEKKTSKQANFLTSSCPRKAVRRTAFLRNAYVAGIHAFTKLQQERRGWPGQKGAHACLDGLSPAMTNWDVPSKRKTP